MREIKFRAWDKKNKKMLSWWDINDRYNFQSMIYKYATNSDFYDTMQYTGLKDRIGAEIYEGDILEFINEDSERTIAICKFGNRRLVTDRGITIDIQCFYFEVKGWKTNPVVSNYKGMHDLEIMEVRGNIYENPELLKKY